MENRRPERAAAWDHYLSLINLQNQPFFCALKERIPVLLWNTDCVFFKKARAWKYTGTPVKGKTEAGAARWIPRGPIGIQPKGSNGQKLKNNSPACRQNGRLLSRPWNETQGLFLVLYKFLLSGRNIIIYDYHGLSEYKKEFDTLITLQQRKCQIFKNNVVRFVF